MKRSSLASTLTLILMLSLSCSTGIEQTSQTTRTRTPTPVLETYSYQSPTPSSTPTRFVPQDTPVGPPTPTPFKYIIQSGDTLSGIAFRFNISLDRLVAANPEINSSFLTVGSEVIIPAGEEGALISIPSPTPVAVQVADPRCSFAFDGGLWCSVVIENTYAAAVENVSVLLSLVGDGPENNQQMTAVPPLNYIPEDGNLPALVYFPPPLPDEPHVRSQLLTALPVEEDPANVKLVSEQVSYTSDRQQAVIEGQIQLPEELGSFQEVWIAAVGYHQDQVIALRKWISPGILGPGAKIPFEINLYSLGPEIEEIRLFAEYH